MEAFFKIQMMFLKLYKCQNWSYFIQKATKKTTESEDFSDFMLEIKLPR